VKNSRGKKTKTTIPSRQEALNSHARVGRHTAVRAVMFVIGYYKARKGRASSARQALRKNAGR